MRPGTNSCDFNFFNFFFRLRPSLGSLYTKFAELGIKSYIYAQFYSHDPRNFRAIAHISAVASSGSNPADILARICTKGPIADPLRRSYLD